LSIATNPDRAAGNATPPAPLLLTPEEAAATLRLSRTKIYALIKDGRLPSIKIDGSRRIPAAALPQWIAQQSDENES
jgi:excisionase family DNA binding protein